MSSNVDESETSEPGLSRPVWSRWPGMRAALYPNAYVWFVLLGALDVMLTWIVLHMGGSEVNVLADWVIHRWDLSGVVVFKFALVMLVILICELVGRQNNRIGRRLAVWAVVVTAIPVVLSFAQMLIEIYEPAPVA